MNLNCFVVARDSGLLKSSFICHQWETNVDYLTNEKSIFTATKKIEAAEGDFLVAKEQKNSNILQNDDKFKPYYVGVIESFEQDSINVCEIYNMANFSIFAKNTTGGDLIDDLAYLIMSNILYDPTKNANYVQIETVNPSPIPYSYIAGDEATTITLTEYLVEMFTKYNIVWEVESVRVGYDNKFFINTRLMKKTAIKNIKNNAYNFINWDFYVQPKGPVGVNKLLIIDKASTSMAIPRVLSTYYMAMDGTITQSPSNVSKPTADKVYLYDTTATENPSYLEIAKAELEGNEYSHEISFDLVRGGNLLSFEDLEVGALFNIFYNGNTYKSVLTGYSALSGNDFITLKFGHVRSTLKQALAWNNKK